MRFLRSPHGPGAALLDQMAVALGMQEGVIDAADGVMSRQSANTIRVAAGKGWVDGDAVAGVGTGRIYTEWDQTDVTVPNAAAGLFRIDQLVAVLQGGHGTKALVTRVAGASENAGHTLDTGAAYGALPAGALRLGAVRSGAAGVADATATNMRDRRPWARGAFKRMFRAEGTIKYTTASGVFTDLDTTNFQTRIECSGAPLRLHISGTADGSAAGAVSSVAPVIDGALIDGDTLGLIYANIPVAAYAVGITGTAVTFPVPGSHVIKLQFRMVGTGTAGVFAAQGQPLTFLVQEILRPNADNGAA